MAAGLITAGGLTLASGIAGAVVGPAPQVAANGNGGYDSVTMDPAGFNQIQTVVQPTQYGTTIKTGAQGVQLCSTVTSRAAQLGLTSNNRSPNYAVAFASGVLPAPGCPTAGVLAGAAPISPALSAVPFGHHVWVNITSGTATRSHRVLICHRANRTIVCHPATITITRNELLFEAQDLDATATGPATDAPGVFTRTVHLPAPQVFNHADAGANEDQTAMVPCAPVALMGPAAYTTAACQPVGTFEFTQAQIGMTHSSLTALATTEGISPNATGALVAPNNTISGVNTGPHGAAGDAVLTGNHFQLFTGNAPTA